MGIAMAGLRSLGVAFVFLTVLPVPVRDPITVEAIAEALPFFPVVGLGLGGILAGMAHILGPWLPLPVLSWVLVAGLLGLTGMLHFDGYVDCCDALWVQGDPQRRLQILRDSRVGSFAVGGAWILLMGKWLGLSQGSVYLTEALLTGSVLGRWAVLLAVGWFPYGREGGLGRAYKAVCTPRLVLGVSLGVAGILLGILGGWGLVAMGLVAVITAGLGRWMLSRLPQGLTGDCYGLVVEVIEALTWLGLGLMPQS